MGINISIEDSKIGGNARILNNTTVGNPAEIDIRLKNTEIKKEIELLSNTKIADAIEAAEKGLSADSEEYMALEKIKNNRETDGASIKRAVLNHIASFANGTLASILASYITKM